MAEDDTIIRRKGKLPSLGREQSPGPSPIIRGDEGRVDDIRESEMYRSGMTRKDISPDQYRESTMGRSPDQFRETNMGRSPEGPRDDFRYTGMSRGMDDPNSGYRSAGISNYAGDRFGQTGTSQFGYRPEPEYQQQNELISKADAKAEIHFIGQLLGGAEFNCKEGLFCEMLLSFGDSWSMLNPPKLFQTQVCYADIDEMFIWAHPIDLFFSAGDLHGWPKVVFRVWRLDGSNKMDTFSYGVAHLPKTSGHHRIECETWTPTGTWKSGALGFFMGTNPRLHEMDVVSDFLEKRAFLNTSSSGKVILELDVLMKNFNTLGISGQKSASVAK